MAPVIQLEVNAKANHHQESPVINNDHYEMFEVHSQTPEKVNVHVQQETLD